MSKQRTLYIGSHFGGLNFFEEDGSPMAAAPYVTLHDRLRKKYYVADSVNPNVDGVSYDAVFSADVTVKMKEGNLALVVFSDSTMENCRLRIQDFAVAVTVPPTPGQIEEE